MELKRIADLVKSKLNAEADYDWGDADKSSSYWQRYQQHKSALYQVPVDSGLDRSLRMVLEDRRTKARQVDYFVVKSHLDHTILPHGWGNGYAVIHKYHPFFGKSYDAISAEAPGGLTFCCLGKDCEWPELDEKYKNEDHWIFGFDTCHWGDTLEKWPVEEVINAAMKLSADLASAVT